MGEARNILVCSNCGYENPRGHRYCGMCGTPFPHRSLTVPNAQSTLSFTSTPLEITGSMASAKAEASPVETPPTERAAIVLDEPRAVQTVSGKAESAVSEPVLVLPEPAVAEPEKITQQEAALPIEIEPPISERLTEPAAGSSVSESAKVAEPVQIEPQPLTEAGVLAEDESLAQVHGPDVRPTPAVLEPTPTDTQPKEPEKSPEPEGEGRVKEPPFREPETQPEAEVPAKPSPVPERIEQPKRPVSPTPIRTPRPTPPVVVMPHQPAATHTVAASQLKPTPVHRSPDSLPITSPPASAGMPTFQEVADAAGAPLLSPFEQLAQVPTGEDEELKQFVANFRYAPPEETADELTMRSEVPVVDKEE